MNKETAFGRELRRACANPSCLRWPNKEMVWNLSAASAKYSSLYAFGEHLYELRRTNRKWNRLVLIINLNTPSAPPLFYTFRAGG
jgi:hypothetical protein